PGVELVVDAGREPARGGDDRRLDVGHRRPVPRHVAVAARDDGRQVARPAARDQLPAAAARVRRVGVGVVEQSVAVAEIERAAITHGSKRSPAKFMNFGYSFWNVRITSPTGPLRCLAMMMSASPGRSESFS